MARASVNLIVGAGSVATLAASLAGVAQADGYSIQDLIDQKPEPMVALTASESEPVADATDGAGSPNQALGFLSPEERAQVPEFVLAQLEAPSTAPSSLVVSAPKATPPALPPLAPLQVGPARAIRVSALPRLKIADLEALPTASAPQAPVDVSTFVPVPAAAPPTQVITVQAAAPAPPPAVVQAPAPQPAPPAPTMVPAPPPPPTPPPPTATTKAS